MTKGRKSSQRVKFPCRRKQETERALLWHEESGPGLIT